MKDFLFIRHKFNFVAVNCVTEIPVVGLRKFRSEVNRYFFLIKIGKTEIEEHFERQTVLSCFPKQQVKTIIISAREEAFSVNMGHI